MKIPVNNFINGVIAICDKRPSYKPGHDGSTKYCDNIGLIRGGLIRSGITGIKGMKDVNQFARSLTVRSIDDVSLSKGDLVLRTCDADDNNTPLPMKYRVGGSEYNGDINNYCDIGVVTRENPLEIMHMSRKGIKKDKKPYNWDFVCWMPYFMEERKNVVMGDAIITSNDKEVRAYMKPSFSCGDFIDIPNGETVSIVQSDEPWSIIEYNGNRWCIFSKFLAKAPQKPEFGEKDIEELENIYVALGSILEKLKGVPTEQKKKRRWRH